MLLYTLYPILSSLTVHAHNYVHPALLSVLSVCLSPGSPGENLEGRFRSTKATSPQARPASLTPTALTTPTNTMHRPMATAPARTPKTTRQENVLAHPPSPTHFPPLCCLTPSRCEGDRWRRGTASVVRPCRPRPSENSCSRRRLPTTPKNWRVWTW